MSLSIVRSSASRMLSSFLFFSISSCEKNIQTRWHILYDFKFHKISTCVDTRKDGLRVLGSQCNQARNLYARRVRPGALSLSHLHILRDPGRW